MNLVVGKSVDSFNATYYFDKTFQAMEAAISAERAQRRAFIDARQSDTVYFMSDALGDIRAYDDACSIKSGLARLMSIADTQKDDLNNKKLKVQIAPVGNKSQIYIKEFTEQPPPKGGGFQSHN